MAGHHTREADEFEVDISTSTSNESSHAHHHIPLRHHIPRLFLFDNGPVEATGLALNSFGRGAVGMSTLFLGPALLVLAKQAATLDCYNEAENESACDGDDEGRVYGMKPTSLLTNIGILSGVLSTLMLPLFGAIIDHTPHRKSIGHGSAIILSIVKGIEIFVSQHTWFAVSILQVVNSVLYNAHNCAVYAYSAELSTVPDEQTKYNAKFQEINYISMLSFLVIVMMSSTLLGADDIWTARISQILAFAICSSVFSVSWKLYVRPRPALSHCPSDSSLLKSGFWKIATTFSRIWRSWYALKYFLLSVMLSESATAALSTISTTYMTHVLEMDAKQIGQAFLFVFIAGIPGSKVGGMIGVAINPLRSAQLCLVVFIINTTFAALVLNGPESQNAMYAFAAIWGVCLGWLHPTHAALYSTIIPRGQESELMGVYIFSGSLLSWLPPFLFSCLNETGISMDIGLASLNVFFAGGFVFLWMIGEYDCAVDFAMRPREDISLSWTPIGTESPHNDLS